VRTLILLVAAAVSLAVGVSASAKPGRPGFPLGVAAGEVTPASARLWARAPKAGQVMLEVLPPSAGTRANPIRAYALRAEAAGDLTVQRTVLGLRPATRYRYRFHQGRVTSPTGTFTTAPRAGAGVGVRFAITGDADATPGPNGRPGFNGFETYAAMTRERNDFNVNFGDTIYSDSELAGAAVARTVTEKWAKYRLGLGLAPLRQLRATAGLYSGWDDHEFVNDFSGEEHGAAIYRDGVRAFLDYTPATYTPTRGLYRTFRWGRHLQLFFLDARSFRSAKATAACGGASRLPRRRRFARRSPRSRPGSRSRCLRHASTRSPRPSGHSSGAISSTASAPRSARRRRPSRSSSTPSR